MKGLLIKDFKLLKGQKNFFFIVCLVGVMLMVTSASPSYVISYMTFVFSMFTLSSVSYDEYDNGLAFLFCLPVPRKKYVREKYVFGFLLGGTAWTVSTIVISVYAMVRDPGVKWQSWLDTAGAYLLLFLLFLLIVLPIQFKFGAEKGRIVMVSAIGILILVCYVGMKAAKWLNADVDIILARLSAAAPGRLFAAALVICCVMAVISYKVSLNIMKKKEF